MITSLSLALSCFVPALVALQDEAASSAGPSSAWVELSDEYHAAYVAWAQGLQRTGGFALSDSERPTAPEVTYWDRFEALAAKGDPWAIAWQVRYASGENDAHWPLAFDRFVAAIESAPYDDAWALAVVERLSGDARGDRRDGAVRFLETLDDPDVYPRSLVVASQLARAQMTDEAALAADLRRRAAFLYWNDIVLAPGEEVLDADLVDLGTAVAEGLEAESSDYFTNNFAPVDDVYYGIPLARVDPSDVWRPVIAALARAGSAPCREWVLFNTWGRDDEERALLKEAFVAAAEEGFSEEGWEQLPWRIDSLARDIGLEDVRPIVERLLENAEANRAAGLAYGLGEALCDGADGDDEVFAAGIAYLRSVAERWPTSEWGKRVAGTLFWHEKLAVGEPCPDFETLDADGVAFELSDYEGQVTVLDFWGFW